MKKVIMLNVDYRFLNFISWKRAICLLYMDKIEIVKNTSNNIKGFNNKTIFVPKIVRAKYPLNINYKKYLSYNKKNILIRDSYICQYCGMHIDPNSGKATVDHILPKMKGGKSVWENCVCCCKICNNKKGHSLLHEVNMKLLKTPIKPTMNEFTQMLAKFYGIDEIIKTIW